MKITTTVLLLCLGTPILLPAVLQQQTGEDYYPSNAPNPQLYWADEDPDSCAAVAFDPALWKAPISRRHGNEEYSPRDIVLRETEKTALGISCNHGDEVYSSKSVPGKKVFSAALAIRHLKLDVNGQPVAGHYTSSKFTASGIAGVRVIRSWEETIEVMYLFPLNGRVVDGTWRPRVVQIYASFPDGAETTNLPLIDSVVRGLKINDSFPVDEPHNRDTGYLSNDIKQLYGKWTVGLCNLSTPAAMSWTIAPLNKREALLTIHSQVTVENGVQRSDKVGATLKPKVVHVGMADKIEVLLEGDRTRSATTFKLHLSGEDVSLWLDNIYSDSPTTLSGHIWPHEYDWNDDSRGDLRFTRSDGKPLDARKVCSAR